MSHLRRSWFLALMLACVPGWLGAGEAAGASWPTYRHDAQRSGVTAESLKLPLGEAWVHRAAHPPRPAWPDLPARQDVWHRIRPLAPTTDYDRAFHVAVEQGRVYYGSSADDSVYCLDAATGGVAWSFTTEGPVRLAPSVAEGKVVVGSDDGCVYCLDAADGRLAWKKRVGPEDRRLPGNERMISLWPVRCGVAVEGGIVYFCAGLFPTQGAYLCAVRAADGAEQWKQAIQVSPQGHLVGSPQHLLVPTGRTAPRAFERAAGKDLGDLPGSGVDGKAGGCFALCAADVAPPSRRQEGQRDAGATADTVVYSSGEAWGIQFSAAGSKEKIACADGLRAVVSGTVCYVLGKHRLYALDRVAYVELRRLQAKKQRTGDDEKRLRELRGKSPVIWEAPCPESHELILAGQTVFLGGDDRVVAHRAEDGGVLWTGTVRGKASGLAVADGALFVSTDKGFIHCFRSDAAGRRPAPLPEPPLPASPYPEDDLAVRLRQAAETALAAAGTRKGYCLVLGAGTGRLAYEIAQQSQFQVIGLEPDARKAEAARAALRQAGLYGTRVSIHQGPLDRLPYPNYFANLVVCEETLLAGKLPASAAEVHRVLRPCGGTVVLVAPLGTTDAAALEAWGRAIPGWKVEKDAGGNLLATARRGPLPGAGEWSHLYADPGNTACSNDAMSQGPVDLQWFGRPGPGRMADRHDKDMAPLYTNGRLFVPGDNRVTAVDAYNGTVLWERDIGASVRLGAFKAAGGMAASDDCLFVASGSDCIALDAQTGRHRLTWSVPPAADGSEREWGYVAVAGDVLLGSASKQGALFRVQDLDTETLIWRDFMPVVCSDLLLAHDRQSGKPLWTYAPAEGVIINPTLAAGGGRVYFVEATNPQTRRVRDGRIKLAMLLGQGSNLVALDLRSGNVVWKKAAQLQDLQHIIYLSYAKEILVVSGSRNTRIGGKDKVRYELHAFDAASGNPLWQTSQAPASDQHLQGPHAEQVQHPAIVGDVIYNTGIACKLQTGEPVAVWRWQKSSHCTTLSASASCAFSRFHNPRMFDLKTGNFTDLTKVSRPGCWINILPAGGLILIPEATAGCTCGYSIQTSIALLPRDARP